MIRLTCSYNGSAILVDPDAIRGLRRTETQKFGDKTIPEMTLVDTQYGQMAVSETPEQVIELVSQHPLPMESLALPPLRTHGHREHLLTALREVLRSSSSSPAILSLTEALLEVVDREVVYANSCDRALDLCRTASEEVTCCAPVECGGPEDSGNRPVPPPARDKQTPWFVP